MKRFRYHHEFWMDFHFWILVLLLAAVALTMRDPLSVVSLAYLTFVGILILLQVFQPPVSTRQYPEGSYHFNWTFYRDTPTVYQSLFISGSLGRPNGFIGYGLLDLAWSRRRLYRLCICCKGKSDSRDGLGNRKNEDL